MRFYPDLRALLVNALAAAVLLPSAQAGSTGPAAPVLVPQVDGPWWTIAGDPDLGEFTDPKQQPVDFAVWQAADGTWQLWSCIRHTKCGGHTRLFHRWEGRALTDADWRPMGIAMQADAGAGEAPGGLQAPHVVRVGDLYHMLYGSWDAICLATSPDGKTFTRRLGPDGKSPLFGETFRGAGNPRDPMVLRVGDRWHCYYTAHSKTEGADYCRTSADLRGWSESRRVAFGGAAGSGPYSAECPFVAYHAPSRHYYLFRTQRYGRDAQTTVYRAPDPLDFGLEDDRFRVATLPVAAPEVIEHEGHFYIASLLPSLKGIRMARLAWAPKPDAAEGP